MSEHETEIRDCIERGLHIDSYNVRGILRELDELRKDNARLREALDRIVALGARMPEDAEEVCIAKAALSPAIPNSHEPKN
jgi:hypothetical protein